MNWIWFKYLIVATWIGYHPPFSYHLTTGEKVDCRVESADSENWQLICCTPPSVQKQKSWGPYFGMILPYDVLPVDDAKEK